MTIYEYDFTVMNHHTEIFVKLLPDRTVKIWRWASAHEKSDHVVDGRSAVSLRLPEPPPEGLSLEKWAIALGDTEVAILSQVYFERWTWTVSDGYALKVYNALDAEKTKRQTRPPRHIKTTWVS
jgi:hypothetical protein